MDTMKIVAEIKETCTALESEKAKLVARVQKIEEELTDYYTAVQSLERQITVPVKEEKKERKIRSDARMLTYKGETKPIDAWAKQTGIDRTTISYRLNHGWSIKDTLEKKVRKNNGMLEYNGIKKPIKAWAKQVGIKEKSLRTRLYNGWTVEKALTTPVDSSKNWYAKKKAQAGKVFMYDSIGNVLRQFVGIGDAARSLNLPVTTIRKIIENVSKEDQIRCRNYYLAYAL